MNTKSLCLGTGIIYYHLICNNYIELNYIIHIYLIDLNLEQIENLSVYL